MFLLVLDADIITTKRLADMKEYKGKGFYHKDIGGYWLTQNRGFKLNIELNF